MLNERVYRRSAIAMFAALERRVIDELARATADSMRIRFGLPTLASDAHVSMPANTLDDRFIARGNEATTVDKVC